MVVRWYLAAVALVTANTLVSSAGEAGRTVTPRGQRRLDRRDGGGDLGAGGVGLAAVEVAEQRAGVVGLEVDLAVLDGRAPRRPGCPRAGSTFTG